MFDACFHGFLGWVSSIFHSFKDARFVHEKIFCFWRRKPTTKEKNFQVLRMERRNLRGSPATDLQTSARRIFPSEIPHIWVISVTESKEIRTEKKHKHPWKIDGWWMRILMTWWMMWNRCSELTHGFLWCELKKWKVSGVLGMDDKKLGLAKMVIQFLTQADSWCFDGCFVYVLVWYSHDQRSTSCFELCLKGFMDWSSASGCTVLLLLGMLVLKA